MEINEDALLRSLELLENDADALGWDKPARLYGIVGDLDDPELVLVSEVYGHPADTLEELFEAGRRPPIKYHGLALQVESWRSINLKEAEERGIVDLTEEREKHKDDWDEWFSQAGGQFIQGLANTVEGHMSQLPDNMKHETRNIIAVTRDGSVWIVNHDRDGAISSMKSDGEAENAGRVPEAMFNLLRPIDLSPDEPWVVAHRNEDGSPGAIVQEFENEFEAQRFYLSLPGHGDAKYLYRKKSEVE